MRAYTHNYVQYMLVDLYIQNIPIYDVYVRIAVFKSPLL